MPDHEILSAQQQKLLFHNQPPGQPQQPQTGAPYAQPDIYNTEKYESMRALFMEHLDRCMSAKTWRDKVMELSSLIMTGLNFIDENLHGEEKKQIRLRLRGENINESKNGLPGKTLSRKKYITGDDYLNRHIVHSNSGIPWSVIFEVDFMERYVELEDIWFDIFQILIEDGLIEWVSADPIAEAEGRLITDMLDEIDMNDNRDQQEKEEEEEQDDMVKIEKTLSKLISPKGNEGDHHGHIPPIRKTKEVEKEKIERDTEFLDIEAREYILNFDKRKKLPRKRGRKKKNREEEEVTKEKEIEKQLEFNSIISAIEKEESEKKNENTAVISNNQENVTLTIPSTDSPEKIIRTPKKTILRRVLKRDYKEE